MINKVTLIGNTGKDAEIRTLQNGTMVANLPVATSESYKDQQGQWQQKTEWHRVVLWGKLAERCDKIKKGSMIYVEGKLTNRKWEDKEGATRIITEIVASYLRIVPNAGQGDMLASAKKQSATSTPSNQHPESNDEYPPF